MFVSAGLPIFAYLDSVPINLADGEKTINNYLPYSQVSVNIRTQVVLTERVAILSKQRIAQTHAQYLISKNQLSKGLEAMAGNWTKK